MKKKELIRFHLDIVHGCQLRCIGCPNSVLKPRVRNMSVSDFRTIIKNVDVYSVDLFRLYNFGEPMLHPKIVEIVETIPEAAFRRKMVEISTNGQVCNIDAIVGIMKSGAVTHLVVSADGDGTAGDYERLRPPAKWDKLMKFLITVSNLKEKHSSRINLRVRTVIEDDESQEKWMSILQPLGWGCEFRGWMSLPGVIDKPWKDAEKPIGVCTSMRSDKWLFCDADGKVVPCCWHPKAFTLGNLLTHKFSEIIGGGEVEKYKKLLSEGRGNMDICKDCGST